MMTIEEIIDNIKWETGAIIDEKKVIELFNEQENKEQILIYGSDAQIKFIEKCFKITNTMRD